jgi:hypothetical protein
MFMSAPTPAASLKPGIDTAVPHGFERPLRADGVNGQLPRGAARDIVCDVSLHGRGA